MSLQTPVHQPDEIDPHVNPLEESSATLNRSTVAVPARRRLGSNRPWVVALIAAAGAVATVIALQWFSATGTLQKVPTTPVDSSSALVTRVNPPVRDQWYLDDAPSPALVVTRSTAPPVRDQWYLDEMPSSRPVVTPIRDQWYLDTSTASAVVPPDAPPIRDPWHPF